ncbi:type II toxin-antitoxin system RelE/ParE family toxin [Phyllobacterium sp. YR531]|uniref:type II toxin-antitoxin system RelE/ParE family toxin n=1 Tax=Phyllobacterium sp. YR531 TaxID=1144343 RepID=UPI00026F756B|nr:type II toxin-antitoxin system RelE/ParE family toxin [Phyllobacterium sp. YR531]EJN04592.1 plasmid stabilization system protein [Phyllobacterium sp. YR531]
MQQLPVYYLREALSDIENIFAYVLKQSQSAVVAIRFVERIYNRCEKIGNAPSGGVKRDDLAQGIRLVPFEKTAVILYRIENQTVQITNIFAGGRDYAAILRHKENDDPV